MNRRLTVFLLIPALLLACNPFFKQEDYLKEVTRENQNFGIKITAFKGHAEMGEAGVDYQFQSKNSNDSDWKEIMVVHHDDGVELNLNNIILIKSSVGLAFVSDRYAVTLDAGRNWKIQSINNSDPSCMIIKADLESDGNGQMILSCNKQLKEIPVKDFDLDTSK